MGSVSRGGSASAEVELYNPTASTIDVTQVEATCPCLSTESLRVRLEGGRRLRRFLQLDLASEPHFIGRLSIRVTGYQSDQTRVLACTIDVLVE